MSAILGFLKFVRNPRMKIWKTAIRENYPEILQNEVYGRHGFIQLQDVTLHYVECGPENGELLLFVHGFPDFWYSWKNQIQEFSKDHRVVVFDMRGYGDSEKSEKVSFYKIQVLVNDVRNLVLSFGREKFTLIAHDWGGVVAHYFIRIYPEMLNCYILMNTVFHPKLIGSILTNTKQFFKSWYIIMMQVPYLSEFFFLSEDLKKFEVLFHNILTPEDLEAYKFTFGSYDKILGPINYYRANFITWRKREVPTVDKLNKMNVPGLYIHGKDDVALTLNMSFKKSFDGVNNIKSISIPNAGHFVHIQNWAEVNDIIRTFLQSVQKPLKR